MSRTIEIMIDPQGGVTVQTKGFFGAQCQDASRQLEQALGARTQEQLTAEFHQTQATQQQQQNRAGR